MMYPKENNKTNDRKLNSSYPILETQSLLTTRISVGVDIGKFNHHISILEQQVQEQSHLVNKLFIKSPHVCFL